jgi:hypothetical protein
MNSKNKYLVFKDKKDDLWELYLSEDNELIYSIRTKAGEGKEKGKIDTQVTEFDADIDEKGVIYFVYKRNNELKHCKLENNQWFSQTIYTFEEEAFEEESYIVKELELYIIDRYVNIFYVYQKKPHESIASICHCLWDGKECTNNIISRINLLPDGCTNYQVEILNKKDILLIFISNDEKGVLFKSCMYINNIFSNIGLLYTLKGNSIDFHMIRFGKEFHILNLSYSNQNYSLEDICIEPPGKIKYTMEVYTNDRQISKPLLIVDGGKLWAFWKIEQKIFYSIFTNSWINAQELSIGTEKPIDVFYFMDKSNNSGNSCKVMRALGSFSPTLDLFSPNKNIISENSGANDSDNRLVRSRDVNFRSSEAFNQKEHKNLVQYMPASYLLSMKQEDKWSKEMDQNYVSLAHQKVELEKEYTILKQEKQYLEKEIGNLRELLEKERNYRKTLEEIIESGVKDLEERLKQSESGRKKLKNGFEAKLNDKGIFNKIFKKARK